jgi:parallel beta-helix repeat protein
MKQNPTIAFFACLMAIILCSCGSGKKSPDASGFIYSEEFQDKLLEKCIMVEDGGTIEIPAGKFLLKKPLSIDGKHHVTIKGAGVGKSFLSFLHQSEGGEGLLVTNCNNIIIEGFSIQDSKGNNIKLLNCDTIAIRKMNSTWTSGTDSTNGNYAYYPVQCKNLLMEECEASYSSDAGIYVGQTINVTVRNCYAHNNVAGIEIENCINSDVYKCRAENNTGGILVFDTPGLPLHNGRNARIYDNDCISNNGTNFGKVSSMVSIVPPGTGMIVLATDSADIYNNRIFYNKTVGVSIIGFAITGKPYNDSLFGPYCTAITIHDNRFDSKAVSMPDMSKDFGKLIGLGLKGYKDIIVDGDADPKLRDSKGQVPPDYKICIRNNGNIKFANLNFWQVKGESDITDHVDHDLTKFDCEHQGIAGNASR